MKPGHTLFDQRICTEEEIIQILSKTTAEENNAIAFILKQTEVHSIDRIRTLVDEDFHKKMDQLEEAITANCEIVDLLLKQQDKAEQELLARIRATNPDYDNEL